MRQLREKSRQAALQEANYHEARVLLLIVGFTSGKKGLAGLTKLAKLDFLLRYPLMMERLLPQRENSWTSETRPIEAETNAVESRMTRYKYGPWDDRYYTIIGALVGKGLVEYGTSARREFRATAAGRRAANQLAETGDWHVTAERIKLLHKYFNKTGSRLKSMIYDQLPDAVDRPWHTEI